jgi:DNA invertase Pin-like site-specific DNA recombinase
VAASIRGWSSGSSAPRSTASISSRESSKCERIEGQLEAARTFAEARGWTVVREFKDTDVSGGEFVDRPGFNALMGAVQAKPRPFEVLVTRDLDRIGRDMFRTGSALQTIIEKKCRIFTYADGEEVRLGNFVEKAMAMLKAGAGEEYKSTIGRNTPEGSRESAQGSRDRRGGLRVHVEAPRGARRAWDVGRAPEEPR